MEKASKSPRTQEPDVDFESIETTWSVVNEYHIPHGEAYRTVTESSSMHDRSVCTVQNAAGAFVIVSIASAWMVLRQKPTLKEFIKTLKEVGLPAAKILCLICHGPIAVPLQIVPLSFLSKIFL